MNIAASPAKRLFVLDTNVLMHDPSCLYRFKEHDIYLPMIVIEELDKAKTGLSEVARNVRQVSRTLGKMVADLSQQDIAGGLKLPGFKSDKTDITPEGKLFLQTDPLPVKANPLLPGNTPDNGILAITQQLQQAHPEKTIVLVTKHINLRNKPAMIGIRAEDYSNDQVIDDAALLYSGQFRLPENFWEEHSKDLESWKEGGHTFYRIKGPIIKNWKSNMCIYSEASEPFEAIVRKMEGDSALIEIASDYRSIHHKVWGINARNREQNFALNFLLNRNIDMVSLLGVAGTGKTLLALAAGLVQTLEQNLYREIIMTRATIPVGEDIGFLPGSEEEKMTPWMGALMDNLEVLTSSEFGGEWGQNATQDLLRARIKIRSMNFMRGRTFLNKFIIIDEAQNLTAKQMKTLLTRAGPGTKVICLGNLAQIDTPYLTETTSGLANVVDTFQGWPYSAHITLMRGERSRLADFASENM